MLRSNKPVKEKVTEVKKVDQWEEDFKKYIGDMEALMVTNQPINK